MALKYWWLLPLGLAALAAVVMVFWRRRTDGQDTILVAHADRLTALPAYVNAVKKRRTWLLLAWAAATVLGMSLLAAAARPVIESTSVPEQVNRDIMLCLDVSGSMLDTDEAIVKVFSTLVGSFKGERIGMTIFDSSSVMVFPLTDDYDFVAGELEIAQEALGANSSSFDYFAGTYERPGSSLIGDGLASCATGFPGTAEDKRSRSIILATDNMLAGRPIFTLDQATELARESAIAVYVLNPNDFGASTLFGNAAAGLQETAERTGGAYHALESESAVESIVTQVQATEAAAMQGAPQKTILDQPAWPLGLALLSLPVLGAAAWRLRR